MNKTIILTSNAYYPNIGGVENSLRYLAHSYVQQGYCVHVVVSDVNLVSPQRLSSDEMFEGIHIHRYSCYGHLPIILRPLRPVLTMLSMYRVFRKLALCDAVVTVSRFHSTTVVASWAGLKRIIYILPGVVRYQNRPSLLSSQRGFLWMKQRLAMWYHDLVQREAVRLADRLVVFSENMRDQVLSLSGRQSRVSLLKPGVDASRFRPVDMCEKRRIRQACNVPLDKTVLLIVGRFVRAKGIRYAIEAIVGIEDAHLLIVGGGEEEPYYRRLVRELRLTDRVTFSGFQQDTAPYYQCSDIFLMTSTYEPLGQTILEALACGLPIVAFRSSASVLTATSEILTQEEAVFVDKLSPEDLACSIRNLVVDQTACAKLSEISRAVAVERFSWDRLARQLLNE